MLALSERRSMANIAAAVMSLLIFSFAALAADEVPKEFRQFIVHKSDSRIWLEKALNVVNLTTKDVGRSFAIVAGVSRYPNLTGLDKTLEPAEQDMIKLVKYLKEIEHFDEIILLKNENMNYTNLRYFLQVYIPTQLKNNPKSRFLFAYSGHGIYDDPNGYLLESGANSMTDKGNAIDLKHLRAFFPSIVQNGHQVLVLLNACYSGAFLQRSFGTQEQVIPKLPGAHAILAGGTKDRTWHDTKVGTGSVFFETLFAGLEGRADAYPEREGKRGDGIITVSELATYLEVEVGIATDERQIPRFGDISKDGHDGGGFFFLSRRVQIDRGNIPKIDFSRAFGAELPPIAITAPTARQGEIFRDCPACPEMVVVPAGKFTMGSPAKEEGRQDDEGPQHEVALARAFAAGRSEVTRGQYRAFLRASGRQPSGGCYFWDGKELKLDPSMNWENPGYAQTDEHPVVCVSYEDAQHYVEWLSKETKQSYRLMSESEWEYAARADTTTSGYWGNGEHEACRHANVSDRTLKQKYNWSLTFNCEDGYAESAPVGTFKANGFGLQDMLGNVWEWVEDCYNKTYDGAPRDGSAWVAGSCSSRVVRGGSWGNGPQGVRAAVRDRLTTGGCFNSLGFRIARTLTP